MNSFAEAEHNASCVELAALGREISPKKGVISSHLVSSPGV